VVPSGCFVPQWDARNVPRTIPDVECKFWRATMPTMTARHFGKHGIMKPCRRRQPAEFRVWGAKLEVSSWGLPPLPEFYGERVRKSLRGRRRKVCGPFTPVSAPQHAPNLRLQDPLSQSVAARQRGTAARRGSAAARRGFVERSGPAATPFLALRFRVSSSSFDHAVGRAHGSAPIRPLTRRPSPHCR
jgi:hypothetical protein